MHHGTFGALSLLTVRLAVMCYWTLEISEASQSFVYVFVGTYTSLQMLHSSFAIIKIYSDIIVALLIYDKLSNQISG